MYLLCFLAIAPTSRCAEPLPYQTDFPPEEFHARWQVVFDRIGDHAVAIIQGAPNCDTLSAVAPRCKRNAMRS
jgi:hypothetical protein